LFFDDSPEQSPQLVAWDESGTQVLQSGPLGLGVGLPTSESVMVPMIAVSSIDVEVPGDGKTIRGAFLDWMATAEVLHPLSAEHRDLIPEPFAAMSPLHAPSQDKEMFGTVTATLSDETIRIGASFSEGAAFQFGMEAQPLVVLLSFEVASPNIDAPPEIFVNGEGLGAVTVTLPDLADPAYRGASAPQGNAISIHGLAARAKITAGQQPESRQQRSYHRRRTWDAGFRDSRHPDSIEIPLG
jgi:hypothetical protein